MLFWFCTRNCFCSCKNNDWRWTKTKTKKVLFRKIILLNLIIYFRQIAATNRDNDSDVSMPNGFIYEFHLHSTHGDAYYIGLNGLEFYDENGERIGLIEQSNQFL